MKRQLLILCLTALSAASWSQNGLPETLCIYASFAQQPPVIDGMFDDQCWNGLTPASEFIQKAPQEGQPAQESTSVRVCYDHKNLYLAIVCRDRHPAQISSRLIPREEGDYGDYVMVILDSYNDKRGAYKFYINPRGIQGDAFLSNDGATADGSWNGIWRSAVMADSSGWSAEMAIPFKNLRFSRNGRQVWGVNFGRYIPHHNEASFWQPVSKQDGYPRISKCGKLMGLEGIAPGLNFEARPYGLRRADQSSGNRDYKTKAGLDVKWSPATNLALDAAVNPDFAQIEADPQSINLSKYETYLSEKRPFFIERADLFGAARLVNFSTGPTWKPFYSRRIGRKLMDGQEVPILFGGKLTGKAMGTAMGALLARTGGLDYDARGLAAEEPYATFGALRLRQDVFSSSTVGLLAVNRSTPDDDNGVYVADANVSAGSFTMAAAGARALNRASGINGNLCDLSAGWSRKTYMLFAGYKDIDRDFQISKVGYQSDVGCKNMAAGGGATPDLTSLGISSFWSGLFYGFNKHYQDGKWGHGYTFNIDFVTRQAWEFWGGSDINRGFVENVWRATSSYWAGGNTDTRKMVNGGVHFSSNKAFNYEWDYFGYNRSLEVWGNFKALTNLSFSFDATRVWQYHEDGGFQRADLTSWQSLQYSLSKSLALRLFVQQNTSVHSHDFNGLVSWTFSPGSVLYLAYNENRDNSAGKMALQNRTLVAKLSYLWSL